MACDVLTASDHEVRDRELFDRIAEQYCRKDLLPASRLARRHRLLQTLRAAPVPAGGDLLEVGCGAGFSAAYLEGRAASFCGVDYSEKLIRYARAHNNGASQVEFVAANIKDFQPGKTFDLIFAIGLLHHLDDLSMAMEHMTRLLKPGGWLVANEPHPGNPLISLARKVRKRVDRNYSSDQQELSADQLRSVFCGAGLTSVRIMPQGLFSTPLAEVPLKPQPLFVPLSALACLTDRALSCLPAALLRPLTWNLVAAGQQPL